MASGFDGELDNFQEPELSSLVKLVRLHHGSVLYAHRSLLTIEYERSPGAMINILPSDSLVDKQGMITQEFTVWDTPGKRKNVHYLASSHLSTDPTIVIINAFPDGPTVVSLPHAGAVSGTSPKSDRAQEGRRTAPTGTGGCPPVATSGGQWPCGHSIMIV
jgi:hypothetical protein